MIKTYEVLKLKTGVIISATNTSGSQKVDAIMELFTQPKKVEVGEEGYSVEDVIEWTDWLGEMGWYRNKQGKWEHGNETGMFMSTTELINHYFIHSLKQKEG